MRGVPLLAAGYLGVVLGGRKERAGAAEGTLEVRYLAG